MAECKENDLDICRFRGDTKPVKRILTQEGSPSVVDITGFSFLMTVNTAKNPDPVSSPVIGSQIFQIVGVLTDPQAGKFQFPYTGSPNPGDLLPPATYYYDMQMTDGTGEVSTIAKGRYIIKQDITK